MRHEVESAYDAIAGEYDAHYDDPVSAAENEIVTPFLQRAIDGAPGDTPILDMGCGTGLTLDLAAVSPSQYMGYDLSLGMLKVALERHPDYQFAYRDMGLALSTWPSGSVGAIVSLFASFNHLDYLDMTRFMRAAGDVLIPGGRLLLVVTGPRRGQPAYLTGDARLRHLKAYELRTLALVGGLDVRAVRGFSLGLTRLAPSGSVSRVARWESAVLGRLMPSRGKYLILEAQRPIAPLPAIQSDLMQPIERWVTERG